MSESTVAELFESAGRLLREEFRHIRETNPHSGEKGAELEDALRDFLNRHLPKRFRAASGILVDFENKRSRQTDVVLYDAMFSPVYRATERLQIVPAHTVAAVVEVKASLTKQSLADAYEKIRSCKALRHEPFGGTDRLATGSELAITGMFGAVFAYSSPLSLETIGEHAVELNKSYDSDHWPDMVVVLDKGLYTYGVQWPGEKGGGHFGARPPRREARTGPAPFYVMPMIHRDGDLTLNGFFLSLLAQLTFFPLRSGVPPFDLILGNSMSEALTLGGYQFDLSGRLLPVPAEMYQSAKPRPIAIIDIRASDKNVLTVMELWRCNDGTYVRAYGAIPLIGLLAMVTDVRGLTVFPVRSNPGVAFSSLLNVSEAVFRKWAEIISSKSNMNATLRDSV